MPDEKAPATGQADDATSEVEKWKSLARKHEDRAKENAAAAAENAELKQKLSEIEAARKAAEDATLTETQRLAKQLEELTAGLAQSEKARQTAELDAMRTRVGSAKGLPEPLIARLSGTTEAEIMADAEALAAVIQPTSVNTGQGAQGKAPSSGLDPLGAALAAKVGGTHQ